MAKTYFIKQDFLEGSWIYKFTATDMKNPRGETLFVGVPYKKLSNYGAYNTSKSNMYVLYLTENTIKMYQGGKSSLDILERKIKKMVKGG